MRHPSSILSRPELRSHLRGLLTVLTALTLVAAPGCKKKKDDKTVDPDTAGESDGADTGAEEETGEPEIVYPEQDPDPEELAKAMDMFLLGQYTEAAGMMAPLAESLLEDSQIRARGIAASIQAMAAAQDLAEHGHAPADLAVEQAGRLNDPELTQYANAAMAVYHLGVQEYVKAEAELQAVVETESANQIFVRLLLAESLLGQAFEDDKLAHPEKLDAAAKIYEAVYTDAQRDVIKGRAADGLTAVGYYKKDKDMTCKWAADASALYETVGASDYMKEGPKGPAEAFRCES